MRQLHYILIAFSLAVTSLASAASLEAHVEWRENEAVLVLTVKELAVEALAPAAEGETVEIPTLPVRVALFQQADDAQLWREVVQIPLAGENAMRLEQPLSKLTEPAKQHRLELEVAGDRGLDYWESIYLSGPEAPLRSFGLLRTGRFPAERVALVMRLAGFTEKEELPVAPVVLTVRDHTDTVVMSKETELQPTATPTLHQIDVTPDVEGSIGPFNLEFTVENEALRLYASSLLRFGYANARVPATSFEWEDASVWLPSVQEDPFRLRTNTNYYSRQFMPLRPEAYPVVAWDRDEAASGERAIRISYDTQPAHLFSRLQLPGNPVWLTLRVKGNGSGDALHVHFHDNINHTLQAWIRNPSFSREFICNLDFTDWREFRVPIVGRGLGTPNQKGSTEALDAPIFVHSFNIVPPRGREAEGRETPSPIWIDSLTVETQAEPTELLTMELNGSDPHGRLTADGTLAAFVGNGTGEAIEVVRLSLVARDGTGETVHTERAEIGVAVDGWGSHTFALEQLAAAASAGPVNVDITASVQGQPAWRVSRRLTLKHPRHLGLFRDFSEATRYSGYQPGEVIDASEWLSHSDDGGEDGSRALVIDVSPEREYNSVVFHPVLPGIVSEVELMVHGNGQAATLQPWFIDSSFTGMWNLKYNLFWPEPIVVDWQGWRKVTVHAPPIPAWYGDKEHYFFRKPWYPLNFALNVTAETAQTIRIDTLRVRTHLPADEEITADVLYADASRLHGPGEPLVLEVSSYAPAARELPVRWRLENFQGFVAGEGETTMSVGPGERQRLTLEEQLSPGIYRLDVEGPTPTPLVAYIQVVDSRAYFGDEPLAFLTELPKLRESVGLLREKLYVDWDNVEPVPNLIHFNWLDIKAKEVSADGAYTLTPVLGFSSDWAGPEAQEKIANQSYLRSFPNYLQIPVRTLDWSRYVRAVLQEYGDTYDEYVFWENPDLADAPQSIPPLRYRELLHEVDRWVRLYSPESQVVAGGFNYARVLDYLEQVEHPEALKFDAIAVQMALGDLSPEAAEMEAFLDDLNAMLRLRATGRAVQPSELDWSIGEYVSPLQQAAYHARASLILNSRGVGRHRFELINTGFAFEGFGVAYRRAYGNSIEVQTYQPHHIPKPGYFALRNVQSFLRDWSLAEKVRLPHRDLNRNRAFVYRHEDGRLAAVLWSAVDEMDTYQRPAGWKTLKGYDAFSVPLRDVESLRAGTLPSFYELPAGYSLDQLVHELRHLPLVNGSYPVALDLHLDDAAARQRADYQSEGEVTEVEHSGRLPGSTKVRDLYLTGLTEERFSFDMAAAGPALLTRRWHFDGTGNTLTVQLNDGEPQRWDLTAGQDTTAGVRASTWLLRGCRAGSNRVIIRYSEPGNSAGYRVEPIDSDHVPLARWGPLHSRQTVGDLATYVSVVGTPLRIGDTTYSSGLGAHATSFIEYPINGHFERFEVTVGIDAYTEGRGSVEFRLFVDGKEITSSGPLNGLSKPRTLTATELAGKQRIILSVTNGGDGDQHDLANWVNGRFFFK